LSIGDDDVRRKYRRPIFAVRAGHQLEHAESAPAIFIIRQFRNTSEKSLNATFSSRRLRHNFKHLRIIVID